MFSLPRTHKTRMTLLYIRFKCMVYNGCFDNEHDDVKG